MALPKLSRACLSALAVFFAVSRGGASSPSPQPISLSQSGTLGTFDPSLEGTPDGTSLWMSYSSGSSSSLAAPDDTLISTRLAYSVNKGGSWTDPGVSVFPGSATALPPPFNQGIWQYEVSSLVYDSDAPVAQRWRVFAMRYLQTGGARLNDHTWIALKTAASPDATWSSERKVFTGSIYNASDDSIVGAPEVKLNLLTDGSGGTPMSDCAAFTEPAALSKTNALYLALNCATGGSNDRVVLLKLSHPSETWSYVGTVISHADAPTGSHNLAAPDLFSINGTDYMLISPTTVAGLLEPYKGCLAYQFSSLTTGQILRQNGTPVIRTSIADTGTFNNGACTYDRLATTSGILFLQQYAGNSPPPQIFQSFVNIADSSSTVTFQNLLSARVYPSPWRSDRDGGRKIIFDQMTANCTVKIFTLSGRWIKTLRTSTGFVEWDRTNDAGQQVASGLYLYLATDDQGRKARGKFAVIQ